MEQVTLGSLSTIGGLAVFIMLLTGLLVKPVIKAARGETWAWTNPTINIFSFVIGIVTGAVVGGFLSEWLAQAMFMGGVTGVFAAATAVGLYEASRARTLL